MTLLAMVSAFLAILSGCAHTSAVETTTVATAATVGSTSATAFDAAVETALATNPAHLNDLRVTKATLIWADQSTVDLRIQVTGEGYCQWFGVEGVVRDDALGWSGQPLMLCDD